MVWTWIEGLSQCNPKFDHLLIQNLALFQSGTDQIAAVFNLNLASRDCWINCGRRIWLNFKVLIIKFLLQFLSSNSNLIHFRRKIWLHFKVQHQFVANFSLFLLKELEPATSQILLHRIIIEEEMMIICSASSYYLLIISNCDLQQQHNMINWSWSVFDMV